MQVFDLDACHQISWFCFKILASNFLIKLGDLGISLRCFSKPVRALKENRTDITGGMKKGTLGNTLTEQHLHLDGLHTVFEVRF